MVDNTYHRVLLEEPLVGDGQESYHRVLPVEPLVGGGRDKARHPRYEQDEKEREQTGQTG